MTEQEFFDKTITHLVTQGRPAMTAAGTCKYRTTDGLKCAIGCHIPDELYSRRMEGDSVYQLVERYPETQKYIPETLTLAADLQDIHDTNGCWSRPEYMIERLQQVAKLYDLNTDVLDSLNFSTIKDRDS